MRKFVRGLQAGVLCLASVCSTSQVAFASNASMGYIVEVFGTYNGAVLFSTTGTINGARPSCQGPGLTQRYAIDASTVAGQAMVAILMTAKAQGKRIDISGMGSCTIWGDTETVQFIFVED